jgi:DNA-3-methyladenine glycosylase II
VSVLDERSLGEAADRLATSDLRLGRLLERNGTPPLWGRDPGFATMVRLILEQQVSLASAAAAFDRLEKAIGIVTPHAFLTLDDDHLRRIGFSRQKTGYVRDLAAGVAAGEFGFDVLGELDSAAARSALLEIRGVGPWTADCYLLFALRRPDAWPPGDRALLVSLGRALGRDDVPGSDEAVEIAEGWRPFRSVAARLLWHDYLGGRG